jgi:hypothetical protein
MSSETLVALIAAATSLIIAVLSLLSSKFTRRRVISVETASRRSDEIRAKALAAGESILGALGEWATAYQDLSTIVKLGGTLSEEVVVKLMCEAARAACEARRLLFRSASYLPEIQVDELRTVLDTQQTELHLGGSGEETLHTLHTRIDGVLAAHSRLAVHFRSVADIHAEQELTATPPRDGRGARATRSVLPGINAITRTRAIAAIGRR